MNYNEISKKNENIVDAIENDYNDKNEYEDVETENEAVSINGVVDNCQAVNLREYPSVTSESLAVLQKGSVVEIDINESTDEFYKVFTSSGIDGYMMKKYVRIM